MRCGVISFGVASAGARHYFSARPHFDFPSGFSERGDVALDSANFVDIDAPAVALDLAAIGDLAARFDVERCLAKDYGGASVREITLGDYVGAHVEGIVSGEALRVCTIRSLGLRPGDTDN